MEFGPTAIAFGLIVIVALLVGLVIYLARMVLRNILSYLRGSSPEPERPSKEVEPWESLTLGVLVNVALSMSLWTMLSYIPHWNFFLTLPVLFAQWYLIGWKGMANVKISYQGVAVLLGGRIHLLFNEGRHWILPRPFMDIESVNRQEMTIEITTQSQAARDAGRTASGIITKDFVEMVVDASIQIVVVNAYKFLGVGESVVKNGLRDIVVTSAGKIAEGKDSNTFMTQKQEVEDRTEEIAQRQATAWGIHIKTMNIKRIVSLRPEVQLANEQVFIEEQQRRSEIVEIRNVKDLIGELTQTGMNVETAAAVVQSERGKAARTITEIRITGNENSVVGAAAVAANILNAKGAANMGPTTSGNPQPQHRNKKKGKGKH